MLLQDSVVVFNTAGRYQLIIFK